MKSSNEPMPADISFMATEEDIRLVANSSDQTRYMMALMFLDASRQLKSLKEILAADMEMRPDQGEKGFTVQVKRARNRRYEDTGWRQTQDEATRLLVSEASKNNPKWAYRLVESYCPPAFDEVIAKPEASNDTQS